MSLRIINYSFDKLLVYSSNKVFGPPSTPNPIASNIVISCCLLLN